MKRFISLLLVVMLVLSLGLTGCNKEVTPGGDPVDNGGDTTPKRDDVIVAIMAPPVNLDTNMYQTTTDYTASASIFDYLFRYDSEANLYNALAEEVTEAEDGMSLTIKIKEGVKFHDGSEVTADDVVFSYNRYASSGPGSGLAAYVSTTLEKVDDYTVKLDKNYPAAKALDCLAVAPIVPQALVEADPEAFDKAPVSCGPYKFASYENNELITLEAFDNYFGGKPAINTVKLKVISDPSTAVIALESGEIDVLYNVVGMDLANLESDVKFSVDRSPNTATMLVGFQKGEAMNNKTLRKALFHAINPEDALISGSNGEGVIATNLYPDPIMSNLKDLVIYENTYDTELAKQLLEESGFDTSKTLKITTTTFMPAAPKAAQSVANNLSALGIMSEVETLDLNTFYSKWMSGDIEIMVIESGGILFNSVVLLSFYTTMGDFMGMNNDTEKSEEFDALHAAAAFAVTPEEKIETGKALLEAFYNKYLLLPMYVAYGNVVFSSELEGVKADVAYKANLHEWSWK